MDMLQNLNIDIPPPPNKNRKPPPNKSALNCSLLFNLFRYVNLGQPIIIMT